MKLFPGSVLSFDKSSLVVAYSTKEEAAAILRKTIEQGIDVYSAENDRNDLEESFLKLLKEGGAA